jgi:ribosomal protein S18 acetylase RimI-like enzyme
MGILAKHVLALRNETVVTIRSALAEDAAAVIDAAKRIFAQTDMVLTQPDEFTITVEEEAALLAKRAESPTGLYVIALTAAPPPPRGGGGEPSEPGEAAAPRVIAIAGLDPASRKRAAHAVTLGIMVDSAWHRRGVGDALMTALMAYARTNPHIRRVQLEVVASNAHAVRLYERHGFVTEGRRRAVFQRQPGVFEDDLIMAADVHERQMGRA